MSLGAGAPPGMRPGRMASVTDTRSLGISTDLKEGDDMSLGAGAPLGMRPGRIGVSHRRATVRYHHLSKKR